MKLKTLAIAASALAVQLLFGTSAHAMIASGMPAIDEIGQYDQGNTSTLTPFFTKGGANNAPNRLGYSLPGGLGNFVVDSAHHRLFLPDFSNRRVLVYSLNSDDTLSSKVATYVIGQPDFNTNIAATTQSQIGSVASVSYDPDGDRLFVSDASRTLVFDLSSGISNGMSASYVIGQPNFTTGTTLVSQATTDGPTGSAYDRVNQRLFVSEQFGNRVMVYDVRPAGSAPSTLCGTVTTGVANGMNASCVLGQALFTTSAAATTQNGLNFPQGLAYDSTTSRLYVAEFSSSRALVYDFSAGISNGQNAAYEFGQADFTSGSANRGGVAAANTLSAPRGVAIDTGAHHLFIADLSNNRVLYYDISATTTNGQAADRVFGQTLFSTSSAATTQAGLSSPRSLAWDATNHRLLIGDGGNNRVVFQNAVSTASISDGQLAADEMGEYDGSASDPFNTTVFWTKGGSNNSPNRWSVSTGGAFGMTVDTTNHRLFVPDPNNNRVLVFNLNTDDTLPDYLADNVLGQPDFNSRAAAATQVGMSSPNATEYDAGNNRLFVVDTGNQRTLVFDLSGGITNGMNAQFVLGQSTFTSNAAATTQTGMNFPAGVAYDAVRQRLFIGDSSNRRVLVFDFTVNPLANGANATYELGQPGFVSAGIGSGATGGSTFSGVAYDAALNRLFVSDPVADNRIMVWYLAPGIANGMAASYVLGKPDFATTGTSTATATNIGNTRGIAWDAGASRLFAMDLDNSRAMVFDLSATTTSGMAASYVIGQTSFTNTGTNAGGTTPGQIGLNSAVGFGYDPTNRRLYISDAANGRLMIFDAATTTGTTSPTLNNSVTLSNYASGATATATISFQLMHNLSSLLTVALPSGFTVTSAATVGASSACLSGFGFTSSTLTASKTNCAGPITLGGAVVTNPSAGGSYTISWTNDDPGSAVVTILGGSSGGGGQPAPPSVMVIQPNGGESLTAGQTYDIVWASGGTIASYRLSYSSDNGTSWNLVASGQTGNFYNWTVPNVTTTMARVRVQAFDGSGNLLASDDTDAPFAITDTPPPPPSDNPPPPNEPPPPPPPPAPTHDYDPAQQTSTATSIDADKSLVAAAHPACEPGTAFRGTRPTVYYCGVDGKRYAFPNSKTWFTWFPDFSNVIVLSNLTISAIPLAPGYATYKPGVRMVKLQTNAKVYAVSAGAVLRLVASEQIAIDLYGADWNTKIDDIPPQFWSSYKIGAPIN